MFRIVPSTHNPFARTNNDVANLFDDLFNDSFFNETALGYSQPSHSSFKVDVKEKEDTYTLEADLPGYAKEEISLEYIDNKLLIHVEKRDEVNEEKGNYIHRERRSYTMERAFFMKDIQADQIKAKLKDGVLTITAPKSVEPDSTRHIDIE